MRRGVEPGLEVVPSKDRLTKGAGRAFAFRATDVNDRDGVLTIISLILVKSKEITNMCLKAYISLKPR